MKIFKITHPWKPNWIFVKHLALNTKQFFGVIFYRIDFKWLASIIQNFPWPFSTTTKCHWAKANTQWNDGSKAALSRECTNDLCWKTEFSYGQQKITKANFCFPKYSILISQSCVDTIGKFKRIEKLTLHVICHS